MDLELPIPPTGHGEPEPPRARGRPPIATDETWRSELADFQPESLIINARVEIDPAALGTLLEAAVRRTFAEHRLEATCRWIDERAPNLLDRSCGLDEARDRGGGL